MEIISSGLKDTQKIAEIMAQEIAGCSLKSALVLALEGELGSGKTTFVQFLAKCLGVKEKILSPTFVLMKIYNLKPAAYNLSPITHHLKKFFHIDCYRLGSAKEIKHLGFQELLKDKDSIIVIEWADRIKKLMPKNAIWIKFKHGDNNTVRRIKISIPKPETRKKS